MTGPKMTGPDLTEAGEIAGQKCPICRRRTADKFRPFCSARCADIDLSRWFNGNYAIPVEEQNDDYELGAGDVEQGDGY